MSLSLADIHLPGEASVEKALAELDKRLADRKPAKVANDNGPRLVAPADVLAALQKDRFEITWVDDVNKAKAKEEILKGVLGAGEFTLFVAKPGTAKSVLLCDMGLHIAAGKDWYGRTVKQGLVGFFSQRSESRLPNGASMLGRNIMACLVFHSSLSVASWT
jgi:hypothetical protein